MNKRTFRQSHSYRRAFLALACFAAQSGIATGCSFEPGSEETASARLQGEWPKSFGFEVQPMVTFGSGHPGTTVDDINEPDGVAFTSNGLLLATDGINHRVDVFDPFNKRRLGDFGDAKIFHGNIVDLAVAPTGEVIVTDEDAHVAYAFDPPISKLAGGAAAAAFRSRGPDMFGAENLRKVGGIAIDKAGRIYTVDAAQNLVRRFLKSGAPDSTFRFAELGSVNTLRNCEGIAIDDARKRLYISSEGDSVVQAYDLETGAYLNQMVGGAPDPVTKVRPKSDRIFQAAVEGLAILDDYLLAVDEADGGAGHLHIFDLREKTTFNTEPAQYLAMKQAGTKSGYKGYFGAFQSPDSVTAYTAADGQSYVALADQGHYQVHVYRWADILKAGKIAR
jgi:DNA-binding beta-propeller fold protein YncE